jgi:hypothetical protein
MLQRQLLRQLLVMHRSTTQLLQLLQLHLQLMPHLKQLLRQQLQQLLQLL